MTPLTKKTAGTPNFEQSGAANSHDGCIGIIESHQHWPRRQPATVGIRKNVLQS